MAVAEVNGITLYYEVYGKGEPLFLINGFGVDHAAWVPMIPSLSAEYKVVTFDNRGVGQSTIPAEPYTITDMAEDVSKLMDIIGCPQWHVFGQSMGGAIAQHLAIAYPQKVKKLILCNAFAKLDSPPAFAFKAALNLLEDGVPKNRVLPMLLPWLFSPAFLESPEKLQKFIQRVEQNPFPQPVVGFRGQGEALRTFESRSKLHLIPHSTLVIASEKDIISPVSNAQELKEKIPNASLTIVPNAGHALPVENPDLLCSLIIDFLRKTTH